MQNKTLLEQLTSEPMISESQDIVIHSEENLEHYLPALTLRFKVKLDKDGKHFIYKGEGVLDDRYNPNLPCKKYELDLGIDIYYQSRSNSSDGEVDEIVRFVIEELEVIKEEAQDAQHAHDELIKFLELTKDVDAMQLYRSLAFYWTAVQTGVSVNLGQVLLEVDIPEEGGSSEEWSEFEDESDDDDLL
jgi:hypothetical protein